MKREIHAHTPHEYTYGLKKWHMKILSQKSMFSLSCVQRTTRPIHFFTCVRVYQRILYLWPLHPCCSTYGRWAPFSVHYKHIRFILFLFDDPHKPTKCAHIQRHRAFLDNIEEEKEKEKAMPSIRP